MRNDKTEMSFTKKKILERKPKIAAHFEIIPHAKDKPGWPMSCNDISVQKGCVAAVSIVN